MEAKPEAWGMEVKEMKTTESDAKHATGAGLPIYKRESAIWKQKAKANIQTKNWLAWGSHMTYDFHVPISGTPLPSPCTSRMNPKNHWIFRRHSFACSLCWSWHQNKFFQFRQTGKHSLWEYSNPTRKYIHRHLRREEIVESRLQANHWRGSLRGCLSRRNRWSDHFERHRYLFVLRESFEFFYSKVVNDLQIPLVICNTFHETELYD